MTDYKKAFEKAVEYIEEHAESCPCYYDCDFTELKCVTCIGEVIDSRNKDYNKERALKCWQEVFLKEGGND